MIHEILRKLYRYVLGLNGIKNPKKQQINSSAKIVGTVIKGKVVILDKARIKYANLEGQITIGRRTNISGPGVYLLSKKNPISIGNFCSIARNVTIQEYNHPVQKLSTYFMESNVFGGSIANEIESKGAINIGHDVWLGVGATILSGVSIGNGAIVAAGSVVVKDVEPYSIVGGAPAKHLKFRFSENMRSKIEASKWWELSEQDLIKHKDWFTKELQETDTLKFT